MELPVEREREKKPTSIIFFFSFLRRSINSNEKMSDMFIYMNRMYASVIDEDRGNIKRDNNYKNTKYHAEKESYINSNWKFYY